MVNSRNKGAAFEREVAKLLHAELGITFKRDLDQYRSRDLGDLIPDDPAFPYVLECKRHDKPGFQYPWYDQAIDAARAAGKRPCIVWQPPRQPIRFRVLIGSNICLAWSADIYADYSLRGFCYMVREEMAS